MISVVTSCSLQGWEEYGQRFLSTVKLYWPKDVQVYVVSEDTLPWECTNTSGFRFLSLRDNSDAWNFLIRHSHNPWTAGDPSAGIPAFIQQHWPVKNGYCYLHDARKFCKKVFAVDMVARIVKTGKLFWIDADVVTFTPLPEEIFQQVLPDDAAISGLLRPSPYTETGFVGYNLDHSGTLEFIARCADFYRSDKVFDLEQWHDCWVFDHVRKEMNLPTYAIPYSGKTSHPFVNSVLGQYMDHLKGPSRKRSGRTPKAEQFAHRNLDYWRM